MKSRTPARRSQAARKQRRSSFLGKLFDGVFGRQSETRLRTHRGLRVEGLEDRKMLAFVQAAGSPIFGVGSPIAVALGDLNNDGQLDLISVPSSSSVYVNLGTGGGSFGASSNVATMPGFGSYGVATGHFNADSNLDIVVSNRGAGAVVALFGNGSGGFSAGATYNIGIPGDTINGLFRVAAANMDGVNRDDIIVANGSSVTVLLNNGTGAFSAANYATGGTSATALTIGDFDGVNGLDVAVANYNSDSATIFKNNGAGALVFAGTLTNGGTGLPAGISSGDFNGDGILDIAIASRISGGPSGDGNIQIHLGTGGGNFTIGQNIVLVGSSLLSVKAADFDGDGDLDLVANDRFSSNIWQFNGVGNGTFASPIPTYAGGPNFDLAVAKIDGDQSTDVVVASDADFSLTVLTNVVPNPIITGTTGADAYVLTRSGANVELRRGGTLVYRAPAASLTGGLTINGGDGDDTLTLDFTGSTNPIPAGGINFVGGETGETNGDEVRLINYNYGAADGVADMTINHTGPEAGNVVMAGLGTITFSQIEPLVAAGVVADLVINLPAGPNADATLGDDGVANFPADVGAQTPGSSAIDGSTFEYTEFGNPTNSLTVNMGNAGDTLTMNAVDAGFVAPNIFLNGGTGPLDTFNIRATPAGVTTTIAGSLAVSGNQDIVNLGSASNSLDPILGPVTFNELAFDSLIDQLNLNDQGDADPNNYLFSRVGVNGTIARTGAGLVSYNESVNSVTLNAGAGVNNVNVDGVGDAVFSLTVNAGPSNDVVTVNGVNLGGGGTPSVNNFNGEGGEDTFNITAAPNIGATRTINVDGGPPTNFATPDILNYTGPTPATKTISGIGAGLITGAGVDPVSYVSIERVQAAPVGNLFNDVVNLSATPLSGAGGQDGLPNQVLFTLDPTGLYFQVWIDFNTNDNGGIPNPILFSSQLFADVGAVTVTGGTDVDQLVVDHTNGIINRVINFAGNGPVNSGEPNGDALAIRGGVGIARETYLVGASEDAGTWVLDPDGNRGQGLGVAGNGDEMVVNFTGLEPASSDTVAAVFDLILTAGADSVLVENGPVLPGGQSLRFTDVGGTFETTDLANKTTINVMGLGGADTFQLNYTTDGAALTTLNVYGHGVGAIPADDNASDEFRLNSEVTETVTVDGQGGSDYYHNTNLALLTLQNLDGAGGTPVLNITDSGAAGTDVARLQDSGNAGPVTATFELVLGVYRLRGASPALINYSGLNTFLYEASAGADTIDVLATAAGTNYYITGNGAADTITIGNQTADFNGTFDGSLAQILGDVMLSGEFNPASPGADDTINVDASGDAALAGPASIGINGAFAYSLAPFGPTDNGAATELLGFAPAAIRYRHTDSTFVPVGYNNAVEFVNVLGSLGADDITINATTASNRTVAANARTVIDGYLGDDDIVVNAANLSTNNDILGNDGNDNIVVNVATHIGSHTAASIVDARFNILSLNLEGQGPAGDSINRDRVIINDTNAGFARTLDYEFLGTQGDLDVGTPAGAGLFGANLAGGVVTVRSTETYIFNSTGANDDVEVLGTADNDVLTVALLPTTAGSGATLANAAATPVLPNGTVANASAAVYLNGAPYLSTPPVDLINPANLPGMSGGGLGPDLLLNGIAAAGLTLNGNGNTGVAGTGDRAVVYAASETDLVEAGNATDIFGLGAGVLQTGFGVGNAYDTINVTDAQVTTNNNSEGALVTVNLDTASFVQAGPADPTQDAALVVNGGDEAGVQANNIADDITATISANFNIQVNGNQPGLTLVNPADKFSERQGDQLRINIPAGGSLNIFSDNAAPVPNVSIGATNTIYALQNTSIERLTLNAGAPGGNGHVNIIGDNNDPAVTQNDYFRVRGRDIDGSGDGVNELQLEIGGNWDPVTGVVALSAPIFIDNVTRLNVSGGNATGFDAFGNAIAEEADTGTDALDITAYADNTPRGWGVETYFNEGDDAVAGDGGLAAPDLLIFNGVLGVSENITIQPSSLLNGQVFSNNAATNTPIAVVNYMLNSHIIVNGSSPAGTVGDTDSLTLRGTDPANPGSSGNEDVVADFNATGLANTPMVRVYDFGVLPVVPVARPTAGELADTAGIDPTVLYNLQDFTNFNTITFDMLGGSDTLSLIGRNDGSLTINVDGGADAQADTVVTPGTAGADDTFDFVAGASASEATLLVTRNGSAITRFNLSRVDGVTFDGAGGAGVDSVNVFGTPGVDSFAVTPTSAIDGEMAVGSYPGITYANLGTGNSVISLVSDSLVNGANLDSALINGTANVDAFAWTPNSNTTGSLDFTTGGVTTTFNLLGFDDVHVDALGGDDTITTAVTDAIINQGPTSGNGTITATNAGGQGLLPLDFDNVETSVVSNGIMVVNGTEQNDTIRVSPTGIVTVTNAGGVVLQTYDLSGATNLILNGLGGDDSIIIDANGALFAGILVIGGDNGDGSDSLTLNGDAATDLEVDYADSEATGAGLGIVDFTGIEHLFANNGAGNILIVGTTSPDAFSVTPTGADTALVALAGNATDVTTNNTGTLTIDGAAGNDSVTINGTAGDDTIDVVKAASTTVEVVGLKEVTLPSATSETVNIAGGDGNDTINISGTSAGVQAFNVLGGGPTSNAGNASDTVNITLATAGATTVAPGSTPDAGVVNTPDGQTGFAGIEFVNVTGLAGGANVFNANGTHDNDTIALQFLGGANRIWINDRAVLSFANYQTVNLNGLFGDDKFSVTPNGLVDVTTINVFGGDPGASDELVVNGIAGQDLVTITPSGTTNDAGAVAITGSPTTNFSTVENLIYNGTGGPDIVTYVSPTSISQVTVNVGANPDAGTITANDFTTGQVRVPVSYQNIGVGGVVDITNVAAARADILVINPYDVANPSDYFLVDNAGGVQIFKDPTVVVPSSIAFTTTGVAVLGLNGLAGDDGFAIPGDHPFPGILGTPGIVIDGGSPSGSDAVVFTGSGAGNVTFDFGNSTITEAGFAAVNYTGIEVADVDAGGLLFDVLGSAASETVMVTPSSGTTGVVEFGNQAVQAGTVLSEVANPTILYSNITAASAVNFDLLGGNDNLIVVGNANGNRETATQQVFDIDLSLSQVSISNDNGAFDDGLITYTTASLESLKVYGLEGDDDFLVTVAALGGTSIPLFVDGGDPIGTTAGDLISVDTNGNPIMFEPGPESDEGGFVFGDGIGRVSFDHIEEVGPIINPTSVIVLGTNADDDITVIARDGSYNAAADGVRDFTVSVNGGPEILYVNVGGVAPVIGELHIDALAGDDDIVITAPAPNGAGWSMLVEVAGGEPSDGANSEGDRLVISTPGAAADTAFYTPLSEDSGYFLLDVTGNGAGAAGNQQDVGDTLIEIGLPIVNADPPIGYNSTQAPGIELFEYDGEGDNDLLTIRGSDGNDTVVHIPGAATDEGEFAISSSTLGNLLGIHYQNLNTLPGGATLTVDGLAGDDTLVARGTGMSDTFTVAETTGNVLLTNSTGARLLLTPANLEVLTLDGLEGDDTFIINGAQPYTNVNVNGGGPGGSDVLQVNGIAALDEDFVINPGNTSGDGDYTINAGAANVYTGIEHIFLAANPADADTLVVNDDGRDNVWTVSAGAAGDLVQIDGRESIDYDGFTDVDLTNLAGTDEFNVYPTNLTGFSGEFTVNGLLGVAPAPLAADVLNLYGTEGDDVVTSDADTVIVNGIEITAGDNLVELSVITLGGADNITLALNLAGTRKVIDAGAENDFIDASGMQDATIFGGDGDDNIIGSPLADLIFGGNGNDTIQAGGGNDTVYAGAGNDILIGGDGNDFLYGEEGNDTFGDLLVLAGPDGILGTADDISSRGNNPAAPIDDAGNDFMDGGLGSDRFVWDPGDGNDTIEGGSDESDVLMFFGGAGADTFTLSQNGTRLRFDRTPGNILLDVAGVEDVRIQTLGGTDTVTINDLFATDVRHVDVNFALPDNTADGAADTIVINGREVSDVVSITSPGAGLVDVAGLKYNVRIRNADSADNDDFTFNANGGNDNVTTANDLSAFFTSANDPITDPAARTNHFVINGGAGDDYLSSYGRLNGDEGNDTLVGSLTTAVDQVLEGGAGNDSIYGGAGDDRLFGERANVAVSYEDGAGNDYLDGGAGNDFMFGGLGEDIFVGLILPGVGNGADSFLGGERVFDGTTGLQVGADLDTDIDTILVQGTAANDRIDLVQDSATQLRYNIGNQFNGNTGVVPGAGTETDTFLAAGSIDEVRVVAGAGDDIIRVTTAHAIVAAGVPLNMLRFDINGGTPGASDRLTVADDGVGNTTVQRIGGIAGDGSFTQYAFDGGVAANGVIAMSPVFYTGIEFASVDPVSPITGGTGSDGLGRVVVFKYDHNEQNQSLPNATHLGANAAVNLEGNIDPGADADFNTPGDEDWYRVVADATGTLDFQVYFEQVGDPANNNQLPAPSTQAGLPGSGNLDIAVYDADGFVTGAALAIGGTGTFGTNDATNDERVRIPAVAGQTYYLRIRGATLPVGNGILPLSAAINTYGVTVVNTPAPVPFDLELSDNYTVLTGAQVVAPNPVSNNATALANFVYNAAANNFTLDLFVSGAEFQNNTLQPQVTAVQLVEGAPGVNGGAGVTQTLPIGGFVNEAGGIRLVLPATAFTLNVAQLLAGNVYLNVITTADAAPGSIPGGHIRGQINILELPENSDTGRSQFDNYTQDNTPTIFLRLDDFRNAAGAAFLADLPGAGGQATPPDETILIPFNPSTATSTNDLAPGYRVAIFDETDANNPVQLGYAQPVLNLNGVYSFTFTTPLSDGSHFISAKVQIIDPADNDTTATLVRASGFGERSQSFEIFVDVVEPNIFFGIQSDDTDGLHPDSDTGVISDPNTLDDQVTSDLTPTFWGTAEANSIIRLYVDVNANGLVDIGTDVLIAQTVATPFDGTNAEPNGRWEATSTVSMNDPELLAALGIALPGDGLRRIIATATDVPGNENATPAEVSELLRIFVDTQGPQVTGVQFNSLTSTYNVFDHKFEGTATLAPTPVVDSLIVRMRDLPARAAGFLYAAIQTSPNTIVDPVTGQVIDLPALPPGTVFVNPGLFEVRGDHNGIIPLVTVTFTTEDFLNPDANPGVEVNPNAPATGYFTLTFRLPGADGQLFTADDIGEPLPDDRFTLTLSDSITDPVGNALDGETNTPEPQDFPIFPSGNGTPGGDFVARFTVDTRPEVGTYASGSAFVDINGNNKFDRDTSDFTNRDITFLYGFTSDALFAGNFAPNVDNPATPNDERIADGFDKLGAYGYVGSSFRWIIDTNNDGVPDINVAQPNLNGVPLNGLPVAGNFDGNAANGDEVGVFTGTEWFLDTDHDFDVTDVGGSVRFTTAQRGYPVVGNIDGLGGDDLVTWYNDRFYIDLASNGYGSVDESFAFGLIGVGDRPVVADMNRDGYDDLGLWQNGQSGINATDVGEFYWLLSGQVQLNSLAGTPLSGTVNSKTGVGAAAYAPPPGQVVNLSILNRIENTSVPPVNPAVNPDISVIQFTPVPFGNDLYIQYGDAFALPVVGNFDPPPTASSTTPFLPTATNPRDHLDVNNDGNTDIRDAIDVIRYLRTPNSPRTVTTVSGAPFYDVTRDLNINITDAIEVIRALRRARAQGGEGESDEGVTFSQAADAVFSDLADDDFDTL